MQELTMVGTQGRGRELARALQREMQMQPEDALEVAGIVLSAFDGQDELDDEELSPDLRSVFYELEQQRLLSFRREETRNDEGHIRRYFHWRIRWDEVAPEDGHDDAQADESDSVYDELPQTAWSRAAAG